MVRITPLIDSGSVGQASMTAAKSGSIRVLLLGLLLVFGFESSQVFCVFSVNGMQHRRVDPVFKAGGGQSGPPVSDSPAGTFREYH